MSETHVAYIEMIRWLGIHFWSQ